MREAAESASRLARLTGDDAVFGRRLFIVGRGGVAVRGAEEALFTLDASGVAVLVVVLPTVTAGTGSEIADELDRIAQVTPAEMSGSTSGSAAEEAELADAYAAFFGTSSTARPKLNHDQQAVVVVRERPDTKAWEELIVELGGQLAGVYLFDGDELLPLEVPNELRRGEGPRPLLARATLAAAGLLLLGVGTVLAARGEKPPAATVAQSVVRDVATGVPGAATHNYWIGQDHLVRSSDGTLLAVYGTEQGLQVVADHANHGRAWQPPVAVPEIRAVSSSLAIDDADRLHVAFSDGTRLAYAVVQKSGGRWTSSRVLEVDATAKTPYLDVAYDDAADVAHVVWVEEGPGGQAPRWAAISGKDASRRLLQNQRLAEPATDIPVLVNVAAGPDSRVVATYRRGNSPTGWFARALTRRAENDLAWGQEERVPTEAGIGAAALVVDRSGIAHLVLRDSTTFKLVYFTRRPGGGWSGGETAVDAESIEEIDFPSLTVDRTSRLVYVFFQSDEAQPETGVQVAVRDPTRGWEPPFPAASAEAIPDGAVFPASISETVGAPKVLWTTGGATPVLQAAVIVP